MYLTRSNVRIHTCLFIWLVLTILVMAETPAVSTAQQPTVESRRETITSQALAGNLIGNPTERTVYVLLPPGYYATSDQRYPVVYVMPWSNGEPSANALSFKRVMEWLLRTGEIEEMIVVVPDGTSKIQRTGGKFMSSSTIGDYETYVTQDVVGYVDTHYRTRPTRDSRGLTGCSRGGMTSMRLGFKYPTVFSVVAATDGKYDYSLDWPPDEEAVHQLTELPRDLNDLDKDTSYPEGVARWYFEMAAAAAPDPDNPPFYGEMPIRIVDGRGEFVPEVFAKIAELDAAHEARRYVQQPVRLRGILIRHGYTKRTKLVHRFVQVLTDLGIAHEYVEVETGKCGYGWEAASLKYLSDNLVFEDE